MTLPASGPLSFGAIRTEFGLGNSFSAYRGKGSLPASGPMKFSQLYGASAAVVVTMTCGDAGFGFIGYSSVFAAGSIDKQPVPGLTLREFGSSSGSIHAGWTGDVRSQLTGKKMYVDGTLRTTPLAYNSAQNLTTLTVSGFTQTWAVGQKHTLMIV